MNTKIALTIAKEIIKIAVAANDLYKIIKKK